MLSDNTIDSDKSSGVPISHQMSTLYLPSDDAHAVATDLKAGVDRCSFQTKNQMVFVKKTHCKIWLYFDMVGHRRVIKGY